VDFQALFFGGAVRFLPPQAVQDFGGLAGQGRRVFRSFAGQQLGQQAGRVI
jgi:hypothetical protein